MEDLKGLSEIPRLYDNFTDAENWRLVMQYLPGETLEPGIQLTRIPYKLPSINNPPVIFRDLKPASTMRFPHQALFLIDFGSAWNFTVGKTRDTVPLGIPGYAAPQQYDRAHKELRSDVFSLGVTLQTLAPRRNPPYVTQDNQRRWLYFEPSLPPKGPALYDHHCGVFYTRVHKSPSFALSEVYVTQEYWHTLSVPIFSLIAELIHNQTPIFPGTGLSVTHLPQAVLPAAIRQHDALERAAQATGVTPKPLPVARPL